jgi:hypothetical protein
MLFEKVDKNMYGLGVGISTVFEIFGNFPFLRGEIDRKGHIYCIVYIACNTQYMFFKVSCKHL